MLITFVLLCALSAIVALRFSISYGEVLGDLIWSVLHQFGAKFCILIHAGNSGQVQAYGGIGL